MDVDKDNDVDSQLLKNTSMDFLDDSFNTFIEKDEEVFLSSDEEPFLSLDEEPFPSSDEVSNLQLKETENDSFNEDNLSEIISAGISEKRKNEEKQRFTRKRLCNPENWKKNISKKAANLGMEYVSSSTKKTVPARSMQRTCGPGCKFKCEEKISETARLSFFTEFWSIPEHSRKYDFILRHVSEKFNKEREDQESKRNFTRTYTINERDKNIAVCKSMFNVFEYT